jgi:hypothetical protein
MVEDKYPKEEKARKKVDLIYCVPENRKDVI